MVCGVPVIRRRLIFKGLPQKRKRWGRQYFFPSAFRIPILIFFLPHKNKMRGRWGADQKRCVLHNDADSP